MGGRPPRVRGPAEVKDILADTHAAIWALFEPDRLSAAAVEAIEDAQAAGGRVLVSAVTPIEATYLTERGRLAAPVLQGLWAAASDPSVPFDVLPVTANVALVLDQILRGRVPAMPSRIVAATALAHGLPLVSADRGIRSLELPGLAVVW